MSETTIASTESPRRAWRQWWKHLPGWLRIGCWALAISVFIQIAVVMAIYIRISFGLVETAEMLRLRRNGNELTFASNLRKEPFQGFNDLVDGWQGRSNADVVSIVVGERGTEEDLKLIAISFPNLESIVIQMANPTPAGIESLARCAKLRHIILDSLEIESDAIEPLTRLPQLMGLYLHGTLVDDRIVEIVQRMPKLDLIALAYTDVSAEAIRKLRAGQPNLRVGSHHDNEPDSVLFAIRWPDGQRSRRFAGKFSRGQSFDSRQSEISSINLQGDSDELVWGKPFFPRGDGEYILTLRLGNYVADPVTIQVQDGKPSTQSVEFQMHVTREQALSDPN